MVQYRYIVLVNTSIAVLMSSIDSTIVTISLPTIGRDLPHTSVVDLLWILLGYQLTTASVLINFGRLADMFGRVRLYKMGFAVFTIGSGLCSFSQNGTELLLFRLVQAVGAGFLTSNSTAIITDAFPANERGKALGMNQVAQVFGSVSGLTLGGILTSLLGWQSIFWVNLPIGTFATLWAHFRLKELAKRQTGQKIDLLGNITLSGGLVSILGSVSLFSLGHLPANQFEALFSTGVLLIGLFVFVETRVKYPMFRFSLFKIRQFTAGVTGSSLNSTARNGVNLVLSLYLQGALRLSPIAAGIYLIPNSISLAISGPIGGFLSDKIGTRIPATLGIIISLFGFLALSVTIGHPMTAFSLLLPLALIGGGFGLYSAPNRSSIMGAVPPEYRGVASGIQATVVQTGSTLSQGIAFLVMSLFMPTSAIQQMLLTHNQVSSVSTAAFVSSIQTVNYISAFLLALAIIPSLLRGKNVEFGKKAPPNPNEPPPAAPAAEPAKSAPG